MLDTSIKKEFPIFRHQPNLVYLDSAATALKPQCVIDAMNQYYTEYSANVHRGIYALSNRATAAYERAREDIAHFIGAHPLEIIFTRNATEAINLVAQSWVKNHLPEDGKIGLSIAEHHSNIVPWQNISPQSPLILRGGDAVGKTPSLHLREGRGGILQYLDIDQNGELILPSVIARSDLRSDEVIPSDTQRLLRPSPPAGGSGLAMTGWDNFFKSINFLALTHVSNVLGTINPIKEIIKRAHLYNVPVLIDASQSVPHMKIDVGNLGCDFLVFSGHKLGGPTGIGVLYVASNRMQEMEPFLTGGDMIREVHRDYSVWNDAPWKFEAGTPHIAGAIGLAAGVNWLRSIGWDDIRKHEEGLLEMLVQGLTNITPSPPLMLRGGTATPSLNIREGEGGILGPRELSKRSGLVSFTLDGIHPHDIAQMLDEQNICVRAGHHCAMPLHEYVGLVASCRASVWVYSTEEEIDTLMEGLKNIRKRL